MIKNTRLSKRNMDVNIGSVKANIDLYDILAHSERPYERHEHNVYFYNY